MYVALCGRPSARFACVPFIMMVVLRNTVNSQLTFTQSLTLGNYLMANLDAPTAVSINLHENGHTHNISQTTGMCRTIIIYIKNFVECRHNLVKKAWNKSIIHVYFSLMLEHEAQKEENERQIGYDSYRSKKKNATNGAFCVSKRTCSNQHGNAFKCTFKSVWQDSLYEKKTGGQKASRKR